MTPGPLLGTLALALLGVAAAAIVTLLRRHDTALRLREAEVERLQERVWVLSEDAERYRVLAEAGGAALVQRDAGGRITFANEGFAGLVGLPLIALIGNRAAPRVVEIGPVRHGPDGARITEEAILAAEGGERWFLWIETPTTGRDGGPERLRAGRDITERVAAARTLEEARGRAEAASVAKSRFLATVSHEFRTPLNGILGMAALMSQAEPSPEQATYLRAIEMSGRALLSLIDEILDFSKIEAGRVDLAAEPFDPAALVEGVVELLGPRAQDKGLEVAGLAVAGLPRLVVGDADRVRQILLNLAGNAVKFTEDGGVGVTVEAMAGGIVLAVADTGPGIEMARLPSLFEEFEQGDGSASRRHEGTGLGLAITRRLVERMGGAIEAESRVGAGTIFRVRLPLPAAEAAPEAPRDLRTGRGAILVVARSPFEAPFLCRRLAEAGFEASQVATEAEALAALAERAFAAVIVDRGLGDGPARAVAAAARAVGATRSLILLSPFDRRDFGAPQDAGFDGYLVKPVRTRSLLAQLAGDAAAAAPSPRVPATARPRPAEGARVLLAEDNSINALLARKALERLGAEVVWARDGLEAVARAGEAFEGGPAFDLALLDIRMPGLDGLGAVRRIRAMEAARAGGRLAVVALTANALAEDEAAARAAGFDGFLPKPLDLAALPGLFERRRAA